MVFSSDLTDACAVLQGALSRDALEPCALLACHDPFGVVEHQVLYLQKKGRESWRFLGPWMPQWQDFAELSALRDRVRDHFDFALCPELSRCSL